MNEALSELQELLRATLTDGGLVSPSIYDTAQVARFWPNHQNRADACSWLLDRQCADGGWGSPDFPSYHRDVPTIASILALHAMGGACHREAIKAGICFLNAHTTLWQHMLPDDIPIGMELILPKLCSQAESMGLSIPTDTYCAIFEIGRHRRETIRQIGVIPAGNSLLHVWEATEIPESSAALVANYGALGISPSATAAWLGSAQNHGLCSEAIGKAEYYLDRASNATSSRNVGVVPNVWPIDVFEPAWMLYTLGIANLLTMPVLLPYTLPLATFLRAHMTDRGLGATVGFSEDGDDTAVAIAALEMLGEQVPHRDALRRFAAGSEFITYFGERNDSLSTTIHALHALRLQGAPTDSIEFHLEKHRNADGVWSGDKWHASWLYPTAHAICALRYGRREWFDERVLAALLKKQNTDGGWGSGKVSSFEETAYAVLALNCMGESSQASVIAGSISKAFRWMLAAYRTHRLPTRTLWIGKELYCPQRVVRTVELTGIIVANCWAAMKLG